MTTIDVDTSPLQAAREWRGIGLVVAARNAGLPVAQAEALEGGEPAAFDSIDEMIASAVVYGASIGIGREEAMALLDRTVCRTGAEVALPDLDDEAAPRREFSSAVRSRSAAMSERSPVVIVPVTPPDAPQADLDDHPALDPIRLDPNETDSVRIDLSEDHGGPSPEQAVAASGEIHIDTSFGPTTTPWEHHNAGTSTGSSHGELEAWAAEGYADEDYLDEPTAVRRRSSGTGVAARMAGGMHAGFERILGTDRADAFTDWMRHASERIQDSTRDGRERLRRSEHATLILAIGGGAVLIALVVAIGGALGGESSGSSVKAKEGPGPTLTTPAPKGIDVTPAAAPAADVKDTKTTTKAPAKAPAAQPTPILTPGKLTLDVYNAGRQKGLAKTVASNLEGKGYNIGEVTNAKGTYNGPTIIYPRSMEREARAISRRTGITSMQPAPGTSRRFTVVVA